MQGRFITVEGGEGAGKSTMMAHIMNWLEQHGHNVVRTREPGGTQLAETIREILLDKDNDSLSDLAELLLVFASRAQHLEEVIRPALARGETVLCDRFTDATWAYQGGGRRISADDIAALEELVHGDLQPDLTLLLDLPVEQGMSRAMNRSESDRFESESRGFFQRVREAYLQRARTEPGRFAIIDASRPLAEVRKQIEQALEERLQA